MSFARTESIDQLCEMQWDGPWTDRRVGSSDREGPGAAACMEIGKSNQSALLNSARQNISWGVPATELMNSEIIAPP